MTVRRRGGLMALLAAAALVVAAGYLWHFSQQQSEVALLLGIGLGLLAVTFGFAWGDARTPLLVADETGLRVRLGRDWTGIPWRQVQRVEVTDRTRLRDGHVVVLATSAAASLEGSPWRTRLAALLNRWLYDAVFVVPYGPTTVCSAVDVQQALERLAAGRAPVVDVAMTRPEPQPTVVTHGEPGSGDAGIQPGPTEHEEHDAEPTVPLASTARVHQETAESSSLPGPAEDPVLASAAASVVSPFRSRPARRAEITVPIAHVSEAATQGMLALSDPMRASQPDRLPEAEQLRYVSDEEPDRAAAESTFRGNVSLIIEATTDLSRRAMSKVRRPAAVIEDDAAPEEAPEADAAETEQDLPPLLIGAQLARARQQLGLSVDDLAERTRIRPAVIEALEVDDFGPAGGDFYARGHLRMLARVLGIDAEELLATYDAHFATNPVSPRQVFEVELASGTTGMIRGTRGGSRWGGLIAAVLVLMIIWGLAQYFLADTAPTDDAADVPQNAAGLGSPGVGNPAPPPAAEPPEAHVKATAVGGDSWIVVRDGAKEEIFAGRLADGESRKFAGESPLRLLALDGGVVSLSVKGRDLGLMAEPGERAREKVPADAAERAASGE